MNTVPVLLTASSNVQINLGAFATLLTIVVALCSIVAFFLGRKKEASSQGKQEGAREGITDTNFKIIFEKINELQRTMEAIATKNEKLEAKKDDDFKQILIAVTKLDQSYKSLHRRVDRIETECRLNHLHRKEESEQ